MSLPGQLTKPQTLSVNQIENAQWGFQKSVFLSVLGGWSRGESHTGGCAVENESVYSGIGRKLKTINPSLSDSDSG